MYFEFTFYYYISNSKNVFHIMIIMSSLCSPSWRPLSCGNNSITFASVTFCSILNFGCKFPDSAFRTIRNLIETFPYKLSRDIPPSSKCTSYRCIRNNITYGGVFALDTTIKLPTDNTCASRNCC